MFSFSKFKSDLDQAPFVLNGFAGLLDRPHVIALGTGNAFDGLRATIDLPFLRVIDDTLGFRALYVEIHAGFLDRSALPIVENNLRSRLVQAKLIANFLDC
jgi:hypothetical protein